MKWPWTSEKSDLQLPVGEAFDILSSRRRVEMIRYLAFVGDHGASKKELAEFVVLSETGKDPADWQDTKGTYVTIQQNHLPRLERAGVIDWQDDKDCIRATEKLDALHELIREASDRRPASTGQSVAQAVEEPTDDRRPTERAVGSVR